MTTPTHQDYYLSRQQYLAEKIASLQITLKSIITTEQLKNKPLIMRDITQLQEYLQYFSNEVQNQDLLRFQTTKQLQMQFDYIEQMLSNKLKILNGESQPTSGNRFPKKTNMILKQWLCQHFDFPYPSKEEAEALAHKSNLTAKQIQIWFINARGRISSKAYNQKKFKNIVKNKYLSITQ